MWDQREEGITKKHVRAEAPRLWESLLGRVPGRGRDERVGGLQETTYTTRAWVQGWGRGRRGGGVGGGLVSGGQITKGLLGLCSGG